MQLASPGSLPFGLHAINQSETRWKYGGGHLKKSKGAPKCSSLNTEGFSWQCWTRAEGQEAGNEPHFRYLRSPAPPSASRGRIGGLRRRWTRGWPRRRVAPSPGRAAADLGRNPGSSPGARPGSAARLSPGPGALLGPSARRASAGGQVCSPHVRQAAREHRGSPGKPKTPSSSFKTRHGRCEWTGA